MILSQTIQATLKGLSQTLERLIPRHCLFCLEKTHSPYDICHHCRNQFTTNAHACQCCALPLSTSHSRFCGHCLSHRFYFDRVYSPYLYHDEIRYLIRQLKYHNKIHYAQTLAQLFILQEQKTRALFHDIERPQVLLPVPSHPQRLQTRGYNQALELARVLASHYQLPLDYLSLIRTQATGVQAGLNARDRQKNIKNAFKINFNASNSSLSVPLPECTHIALIDDVMTTGSTLNEVARILKQAGVERIDAWVIARA